jgi:hypothetical protein
MAGKGEIYRRMDGRYTFEVLTGKGVVVATAPESGFASKAEAKKVLEKLLRGDYDGPVSTD